MHGHVVLLGDSIFDNASYVSNGKCVSKLLERRLGNDWKVTLLAVDGSTLMNVLSQTDNVPGDATHLVLSVGGNDALWVAGELFSESAANVEQSLMRVGLASQDFAAEYGQLVRELSIFELPLTLCTVYDSVPNLSCADKAGLSVFNDVITRTAFATNAALIDLRNICTEKDDYAGISPIEPSEYGGAKIARAISDAVLQQGNPRRVIV